MPDQPDDALEPYLDRIERHLDASPFRRSDALRLETWEIEAFRRGQPEGPDDLYRRAAALRLKIDDEVRELSAAGERKVVDEELARRIEWTLARARDIDAAFDDLMAEGPFPTDSLEIEQMNRSQLRLIRVFSGLWLLNDEITRGRNLS